MVLVPSFGRGGLEIHMDNVIPLVWETYECTVSNMLVANGAAILPTTSTGW